MPGHCAGDKAADPYWGPSELFEKSAGLLTNQILMNATTLLRKALSLYQKGAVSSLLIVRTGRLKSCYRNCIGGVTWKVLAISLHTLPELVLSIYSHYLIRPADMINCSPRINTYRKPISLGPKS